jgi:hypothetical protein
MGFIWQPRAGTYAQTVVVKGTFRLQPGESVLAETQEAPTEVDRSPYKSKADVVLVGHAYAPGKQPVRSWMTQLVVGEIDKSIEVWCDRVIRWQDGTLLEGPRVTKVPLVWERAAGGPETSNPVGMRFDAPPDQYGVVPIPNLQPPGIFVSSRADTFVPVCFGPIAPEWPRPSAQLGRLAPGWEGRPFPDRFDYGYFQSAPLDQQVSAIRANERIVMENLHPEHARLVTNLPGLQLRAVLDRATGEREEVKLFADTLSIDTDRGTCSVVWRGRVALRHATEAGRIAIWVEGMPLREVTPTRVDIEDGDVATTMTLLAPLEKKAESVLPFVPGLSRLSESDRRLVEGFTRRMGRAPGDGTETLSEPMVQPAGQALPFEREGDASNEETDMAKTLPPMPKVGMTPVPFVVPSFPTSLPELSIPKVQEEPGEAPNPLPAPPPMIGPIATSERGAGSEAAPRKDRADDAEATAPPPVVKAEEPKKSGPEAFPLERCAALTASIARRKAERGRILEAEGLTEKEWGAIEKYWADAIKVEIRRGKREMMDRFDQAYVGRLEEERGPITVEEYARLSVAGERGTLSDIARELGVPQGSMMRITRIWARKLAKDPELGARVQVAVRVDG